MSRKIQNLNDHKWRSPCTPRRPRSLFDGGSDDAKISPDKLSFLHLIKRNIWTRKNPKNRSTSPHSIDPKQRSRGSLFWCRISGKIAWYRSRFHWMARILKKCHLLFHPCPRPPNSIKSANQMATNEGACAHQDVSAHCSTAVPMVPKLTKIN